MLFCVNFGTHHKFDKILIYNNLLFFPSNRLRDATFAIYGGVHFL